MTKHIIIYIGAAYTHRDILEKFRRAFPDARMSLPQRKLVAAQGLFEVRTMIDIKRLHFVLASMRTEKITFIYAPGYDYMTVVKECEMEGRVVATEKIGHIRIRNLDVWLNNEEPKEEDLGQLTES